MNNLYYTADNYTADNYTADNYTADNCDCYFCINGYYTECEYLETNMPETQVPEYEEIEGSEIYPEFVENFTNFLKSTYEECNFHPGELVYKFAGEVYNYYYDEINAELWKLQKRISQKLLEYWLRGEFIVRVDVPISTNY